MQRFRSIVDVRLEKGRKRGEREEGALWQPKGTLFLFLSPLSFPSLLSCSNSLTATLWASNAMALGRCGPTRPITRLARLSLVSLVLFLSLFSPFLELRYLSCRRLSLPLTAGRCKSLFSVFLSTVLCPSQLWPLPCSPLPLGPFQLAALPFPALLSLSLSLPLPQLLLIIAHSLSLLSSPFIMFTGRADGGQGHDQPRPRAQALCGHHWI